MGIFDRFFGPSTPERRPIPPRSADEQALERYRYLLKTAPPEAIEQAHAEAFAQLTPQQRQMVLQGLGGEGGSDQSADPKSLARLATRAELRRPGTMERTFGGMGGFGGGPGLGGMFAGSLLSSIAGTFIGTAIAHQFLGGFHGADASDSGDSSDSSEHASDDSGGDDSGGDDSGGGYDDGGGDFGGGDFGDV